MRRLAATRSMHISCEMTIQFLLNHLRKIAFERNQKR